MKWKGRNHVNVKVAPWRGSAAKLQLSELSALPKHHHSVTDVCKSKGNLLRVPLTHWGRFTSFVRKQLPTVAELSTQESSSRLGVEKESGGGRGTIKSYRWNRFPTSARHPARALGCRAPRLTWYTSRSPHHVRSTWWQARSLSVYHLRSVDTVKFHTKRLPLNSRSSTPHMNTEAMPSPSRWTRGCPGGSRSCSPTSPIAAARPPGLRTPASAGRRRSSLPPNWSFTVRPGQARAACPGIGRPPANGCGGHTEAQCPPRPLAGSAERAALSSARRALGAPGAREARTSEDSPWRSPSALGSGGSGATLCRQTGELHLSALGSHVLHTPHTRAYTHQSQSPNPLWGAPYFTLQGFCLASACTDKYLPAARDAGGKKKFSEASLWTPLPREQPWTFPWLCWSHKVKTPVSEQQCAPDCRTCLCS